MLAATKTIGQSNWSCKTVSYVPVSFDKLLLQPRFRCIEKIKTIGATYMVASGLNSENTVTLYFYFGWEIIKACQTFTGQGLRFLFRLTCLWGVPFGEHNAPAPLRSTRHWSLPCSELPTANFVSCIQNCEQLWPSGRRWNTLYQIVHNIIRLYLAVTRI